MRKIVLLPEPLGPSRPTISPRSMAKDTSLTARRGPYHLVTCCASTSGDIDRVQTRRRRRTARHDPGRKTRDRERLMRAVRLLVKFRRVLVSLVNVRIVR